MERGTLVGVLIVVVIVAFQVATTMRVWRSKLFDRPQKLAQSQLIWFLPLIGAAIVMSVLEDEVEREKGPPPGLGR
ncbi:MAG TPA: hypothetical protein VFV94_07775 [Polyangiaceae bacterium]|nr:hypothetical protein [Polyangiaceae bacterium]